ncbi:hypothetical protein IAU60_006736 [Kwoniella sp. DSM 27419]
MSAFLTGAAVECGPSNVLKNVQGRIDRDYSLQQDRLISTPNVAGSSKQPFRPSPYAPPILASQIPTQSAQSPFDLSTLREYLPSPSHTVAPHPYVSSAPVSAGWAEAFRAQTQAGPSLGPQVTRPPQGTQSGWSREFSHRVSPVEQVQITPRSTASPAYHQVGPAPWHYQPYLQTAGPRLGPQPLLSPAVHQDPDRIDHSYSARGLETATQQNTPPQPLTESQDVLARTARSFVSELDGVSNSVLADNPKLPQSRFMGMLRGLGRGAVVIKEGEQGTDERPGEGAKLVSRGTGASADWAKDFAGQASTASPSVTSSAREPHAGPSLYAPSAPFFNMAVPALDRYDGAYDHPPSQSAQMDAHSRWEAEFSDQEALLRTTESDSLGKKNVHFDRAPPGTRERERSGVPNNLEEALRSSTTIPGSGNSWAEQGLDEEDFDEEVFMGFNGFMKMAAPLPSGVGEQEGWGQLQEDWDNFKLAEPGPSGARGMGLGDRTERYLFQSRNPYAESVSEDREVPHLLDSPTLKGVLALEAAVQRDPSSHEAWFALGLKQQENEREDQAILALSKVVQLEPGYRDAYLALAVSYTNEGESEAACTMLERWIILGEPHRVESVPEAVVREKHWGKAGREELITRLIDVARRSPESIDADVQVALGVLFNATEEYDKAEDCFLAALDVRPDDWLLYNRLGATLANSGRSNEAIQYYHKALSLHPNFVRALFNLGISYTNLGQYRLGAQSALDALRIQHADASEGYAFGDANGAKGVTSDALWNTLRAACTHMYRHDLVKLVQDRNLSGFPMNLVTEDVMQG